MNNFIISDYAKVPELYDRKRGRIEINTAPAYDRATAGTFAQSEIENLFIYRP